MVNGLTGKGERDKWIRVGGGGKIIWKGLGFR